MLMEIPYLGFLFRCYSGPENDVKALVPPFFGLVAPSPPSPSSLVFYADIFR